MAKYWLILHDVVAGHMVIVPEGCTAASRMWCREIVARPTTNLEIEPPNELFKDCDWGVDYGFDLIVRGVSDMVETIQLLKIQMLHVTCTRK